MKGLRMTVELTFKRMPINDALSLLVAYRDNYGHTHASFKTSRWETKPAKGAPAPRATAEYAQPGKVRLTGGNPGKVREFKPTADA